MMSLLEEHGRVYVMLDQFLMVLQAEIISTENSDYLKQIIFLRPFNSMFPVVTISSRPDELLQEREEPKVG